MIFRKSQQLFLVNRQILFNLRQLFSRNKTSNLLVIPRHFLINNRHLFHTKSTPLVHLFSKTTKNLAVNTTETNTIQISSLTSNLLIQSLKSVNLHQSLHSPSLVGGQLILDVLSNFHFHRENTIPATNPSVKTFFKKISTILDRGDFEKSILF